MLKLPPSPLILTGSLVSLVLGVLLAESIIKVRPDWPDFLEWSLSYLTVTFFGFTKGMSEF